MIEINLLPESLRRKETARIAMPEIPIKKSLYLVGGAVAVIQILLTLFAFYVQLELISVHRKIAVIEARNKEVVRQKAETVGLTNRMKEIRSLTARKFYWTSLLNELSNSMTKGIWLRNLYVVEEEARAVPAKVEKDKKAVVKAPEREKYLVLEGTAIGAGQETAFIGKFLKELKDNSFFTQTFQEIKPSDINQKRIGEHEVYDFMIRCQFKKDKTG